MEYTEFLESKGIRSQSHGIEVELDKINSILFPFQRDNVRWALRKGK